MFILPFTEYYILQEAHFNKVLDLLEQQYKRPIWHAIGRTNAGYHAGGYYSMRFQLGGVIQWWSLPVAVHGRVFVRSSPIHSRLVTSPESVLAKGVGALPEEHVELPWRSEGGRYPVGIWHVEYHSKMAERLAVRCR